MDVNKTVKINNLARELLKHGLVSSLEEGVQRAEAMEKDSPVVEAAAVNSGNDAAPEAVQSQPSQVFQSSQAPQSVDSTVFERKLNYLAKSFAEQFNKEMGEVRKQIDMLNNDIKSMKEKMKGMSSQSRPVESQQQSVSEKPKQAQKKGDDVIKPRTGDLTPDDVSLEDYFYFGNKR